MRDLKIARWTVAIVALVTMVSPFAVAWNRTHVYSPGLVSARGCW